MGRKMLTVGSVSVAVALLMTTLQIWSEAKPQTARPSAQEPDAITKLIAGVKHSAAEMAKAGPDRFQIFLALAQRNGEIEEVLQPVKKQKLHERAVASLLKLVEDTKAPTKLIEQFTCGNAIFALGELGIAAKQAVTVLTALKDHKDAYIREQVADALKKIQK